MWVLLLDNKLRITHEVMVYRGTINTTHIRQAELLKEAIRVNAPALILSHCHPSGDPTPSPEDVKVTELVSRAAGLLGVTVEDHIIIGQDKKSLSHVGKALHNLMWCCVGRVGFEPTRRIHSNGF